MSDRDLSTLAPATTPAADKATGDAWLSRIRTRLDGHGHQVASGVWRQLSPELRAVLVSLCTDRKDPHSEAYTAWASFTTDERTRMGAFARQLQRELKGAAWLR